LCKHYTVLLSDGDTLSVVAALELSCHDPAQRVAAVAQRYRVVADVCAPTLALVPLNANAGSLSHEQLAERQNGSQ
jgi:hypothetical protein